MSKLLIRRQEFRANYRGINSLTAVRYTTPNSLNRIAQEVCFQLFGIKSVVRDLIEQCRYLWLFVASAIYVIIYSRTSCFLIYNPRAIADALDAGGDCDAFIIFAKTSGFTDEEIALCQTAQGRYRHRVILLSDRELEPYFIYEASKDRLQNRSWANSFDDMVSATDQLFFSRDSAKPRT